MRSIEHDEPDLSTKQQRFKAINQTLSQLWKDFPKREKKKLKAQAELEVVREPTAEETTKRKRNISIKSLINSKGEKLEDPNKVVYCLNEHLCSVAERMAEDCLETDKDPIDYITCDIKHTANFSPTSSDEVSKLIKSLKNNKACGYDLISNRILN